MVGVFCLSSGSAELEWEVIFLSEAVPEVRRLLRRTMMDGWDVAVTATWVCDGYIE